METNNLHVISHTHWDREWYLTFQQFRIRLVDLVDHLLDILDNEPDFKYFNMDGQTIVLEDYLAIKPQNEAKLRKYISEGRILVGPWYQLNDENLVSGESTIRSLLIGHRIAADFGSVMKVGYLPDQFGNISQMPQIFRGFGIDGVIFGRGKQLACDDDKMEMIWASPDGSEVVASLMAFWYNNAQRFPNDTAAAIEYAKSISEKMSPHTVTGELLLMNGVDHLEAQGDVGDIIRRVNEAAGDVHLVHTTFPAYIEAVKNCIDTQGLKLNRVEGELREDRDGNVLAGTLSARMYIKQANVKCETWLEKYTEPSCAFASMAGAEYPRDMLRYAWKHLMKNHPHDSICGCSIDQVHAEMMPRFDEVEQIARELTDRSLSHISSQIGTKGETLVVFNPLSWVRTERVIAEIEFKLGENSREAPQMDDSLDVQAIELIDTDGGSVPYRLLESVIYAKSIYSPVELPMSAMTRKFTIEFIAENVPSCGYTTYTVKPVDSACQCDRAVAGLTIGDGKISNEYLEVGISNGGISIKSNDGACAFDNICALEDAGDVGDEYRYGKPEQDTVITTASDNAEIRIIDNSPISATIVRKSVLNIPVSATPDQLSRSYETVACPVTSRFTLSAKSSRVDVVTEIENLAKDHRLRAVFPSGVKTDVSHAEMPFDVVSRSIRPPSDWQGASTFFPQKSWMDVNDGEKGLAVLNKGLPEYEVYDDESRTVAVTLLRCVGCLSGSGDTAGVIPTPGAQCIGKHTSEYSVFPHAGSWGDARVWAEAGSFNTPFICAQTGAHYGVLPLSYSFIEIAPSSLVVSAIKQGEGTDSLIVRFYNVCGTEIKDAEIRVNGSVSARRVNMNEEPLMNLAVDSRGTVRLDVRPSEIVTIEFSVITKN